VIIGYALEYSGLGDYLFLELCINVTPRCALGAVEGIHVSNFTRVCTFGMLMVSLSEYDTVDSMVRICPVSHL